MGKLAKFGLKQPKMDLVNCKVENGKQVIYVNGMQADPKDFVSLQDMTATCKKYGILAKDFLQAKYEVGLLSRE